ncbi:unnamed protein product [Adineta ricciae]|uniref:Uncharacterized protein n=1 Tax=Adineta ricciae TaxID=249248 RepID=A0A813UIA6_ADIRI|nr:unnamed protein product [Adineta ricciae]
MILSPTKYLFQLGKSNVSIVGVYRDRDRIIPNATNLSPTQHDNKSGLLLIPEPTLLCPKDAVQIEQLVRIAWPAAKINAQHQYCHSKTCTNTNLPQQSLVTIETVQFSIIASTMNDLRCEGNQKCNCKKNIMRIHVSIIHYPKTIVEVCSMRAFEFQLD